MLCNNHANEKIPKALTEFVEAYGIELVRHYPRQLTNPNPARTGQRLSLQQIFSSTKSTLCTD